MIGKRQSLGEALLGLGRESFDLHAGHVMLRAVLVFLFALVLVRAGEKRFMGRSTAIDLILAIILGSVLSRAITGQAPFLPTLAAGGVLVVLHWLIAAVAFRSDRFATLVKGRPRTLVRDGQIQWDAMRKSHIGQRDLLTALRVQGRLTDVDKAELVQLERSGEISVIPKDADPRVLEVRVEPGVQTIRIEMKC